MNIQIQAVNFTAKKELQEFTELKLKKLNNYFEKIITVNVYLKVENSSSKQNKLAEILVQIPGEDLVVKKQGQSFEECISLSIDTMKKLLIKRKEKISPTH